MPSIHVHDGKFFKGMITETQGSFTDTLYASGLKGKYDSDLVICGGRFSDRPTATIDPECNVYTSSRPGVIYKYQVAKPDWFTIKIR
jgi:hypothetical protein